MTKDKKKVLISIPCLAIGGTEQHTFLLTRALLECGYHVEILVYFEWHKQVVEAFRKTGAKVSLLNWHRSISKISFILSLNNILQDKDPDIVHVQYMTPGLLPILAARLAKVPLIFATVHQPGTPYGILARNLLKCGAQLTNCFVCVSKAAENSWFGNTFLLEPKEANASYCRKRHLTIPNAVDIENIDKALKANLSKAKEIKSRMKDKIIIGTVARLSREKGIDILLEAFSIIHKQIPHVSLLIIGDGPERSLLQDYSMKLGINDSIIWTGFLPWEEAIGVMGIMDIVAVPSRFEGFGLTAVEAMAFGKPVIASRVDGLAEIIQDGVNGFLVPSEDEKSFAAQIVVLLKDEAQRKLIGQTARKHVEDNYSYTQFSERYRHLYLQYTKRINYKY